MSLKDELLAAIEAAAAERPKEIKLKGFPTFYVRGRTVGEVDEQPKGGDEWIKNHSLTATAAMVICDEEGTLLFDPTNDADMATIKKFLKMPWSRMQKILSAVSDEDTDAGN